MAQKSDGYGRMSKRSLETCSDVSDHQKYGGLLNETRSPGLKPIGAGEDSVSRKSNHMKLSTGPQVTTLWLSQMFNLLQAGLIWARAARDLFTTPLGFLPLGNSGSWGWSSG